MCMVEALNTSFSVERSEENVTTIYVETLTNAYKDLYNATVNGEKTVLKAVEEGDDYIIATTKVTVGGNTTKEIVRIEEGSEPKVLLNSELYTIIEEQNKAAAIKAEEEEKAKAQAIVEEKAAKQQAVADHIIGTLDVHVKEALESAKLDFDKLVKESRKKSTAIEKGSAPATVVEKVKKEEEVVVEKAEKVLDAYKEKLSETSKYIQDQIMEDYDPVKGDKDFQGDMVALKAELEAKIKNLFTAETNNFRRIAEMSSGGGGGIPALTTYHESAIAALSADIGAFETASTNLKEDFQGYIALLSPVYFGGSATTFDIPLEDVNTFLDLQLDVYEPGGEFDYRVTSMKDANAEGYLGTGAAGDPLIFLLEGLEITSTANVRVSLSFDPDDDGGRLESRLLFNRHSGIPLSGTDFSIEASSIAMESGADEDYSYTPNIQFFVGDTIDTNGPGDAGKVRFQIRTDVPGTVTVNEIAMFIQK